MAKPKTQPRNAPKASDARRKVKEFYALGIEVRKADTKASKRGKGIRNWDVFKQFEKRGYSRNQIEKARMFATMYTREDLNEMLALGTKVGMPLGPRHVVYLLSLKDRRTRRSFQKCASENRWSTRDLAIEIKKRLGKQSTGGRHLRVAQTRDEALIQVEAMSSQWVRWFRNLRDAGLLVSRNPALRTLKAITPKIEKLQKTVAGTVGARPLSADEELSG